MRKWSLIAMLFFSILSFSQKTKKELQNAYFLRLSEINDKMYDDKLSPDSIILYENESIKFLKKSYSNREIALSLKILTYLNCVKTDFDKALTYNNQHFKISLKRNDKKGLAGSYYSYCFIYLKKADYPNAIKYGLKAIEYNDLVKNEQSVCRAFSNISISYIFQKNYYKSLFYANQYYNRIKNRKDLTKEIAEINILFGWNYLELYKQTNNKGFFLKSELYFKKGNDEFVKTNALKNTYWAQQHWSELYEKVNPVRSLKMRLKVLKSYDSLKISTTLTDEIIGDIAMNYDNISRNKDLTNKLNINNLKNYEYVLKQNANSYYNRYFKQSNLKDNLLNYQLVLKQYSSFEFKRFNYKSAFEKLSLSTKINDSIFSQENKNKIAKLEAEKEIQINKLKLAAEQKQKYLYILGLGFMSILGLLLVYQNKKRKTANQKLALLNNELDQANKVKMRFFCILNHDLRSPVSNLIDYLHLQRDSPELMDESSKKRMETNTISGAENLLSSMEDILLWSKGQMEQFKPVIKNIAVSKIFDDNKKVFSGYQKIKFVYENNENLIVNTDENYLKTIVRNLTSNAINVFSTTENPIIIWKSYSINNKNYLSITDNGPGSNQENFKALYDENEVVGIKSGLGLHLIRDLAKAINCDIKVDSKIGVGTTFILSL